MSPTRSHRGAPSRPTVGSAGRLAAVALIATAVLVLATALVSCSSGSRHSPAVPVAAAGTVTDSGFSPAVDGLPFANYGNRLPDGSVPTNLTAADVLRMFGTGVCVYAQTDPCRPTPGARAWLDSVNRTMAAGHCYGISVLAELFWQRRLDPATFGSPAVNDLRIAGNRPLQRQIAYYWTLQTLRSVQAERLAGTPNEVLLTLIGALKPGARQAYTLLMWTPNGKVGHAVTPYAIRSLGGGRYDVVVYDSDRPRLGQVVHFDAVTDTWSYPSLINPLDPRQQYRGSATTDTVALDPTGPAVGKQPCPFCARRPGTTPEPGPITARLTGTGPPPTMPAY